MDATISGSMPLVPKTGVGTSPPSGNNSTGSPITQIISSPNSDTPMGIQGGDNVARQAIQLAIVKGIVEEVIATLGVFSKLFRNLKILFAIKYSEVAQVLQDLCEKCKCIFTILKPMVHFATAVALPIIAKSVYVLAMANPVTAGIVCAATLVFVIAVHFGVGYLNKKLEEKIGVEIKEAEAAEATQKADEMIQEANEAQEKAKVKNDEAERAKNEVDAKATQAEEAKKKAQKAPNDPAAKRAATKAAKAAEEAQAVAKKKAKKAEKAQKKADEMAAQAEAARKKAKKKLQEIEEVAQKMIEERQKKVEEAQKKVDAKAPKINKAFTDYNKTVKEAEEAKKTAEEKAEEAKVAKKRAAEMAGAAIDAKEDAKDAAQDVKSATGTARKEARQAARKAQNQATEKAEAAAEAKQNAKTAIAAQKKAREAAQQAEKAQNKAEKKFEKAKQAQEKVNAKLEKAKEAQQEAKDKLQEVIEKRKALKAAKLEVAQEEMSESETIKKPNKTPAKEHSDTPADTDMSGPKDKKLSQTAERQKTPKNKETAAAIASKDPDSEKIGKKNIPQEQPVSRKENTPKEDSSTPGVAQNTTTQNTSKGIDQSDKKPGNKDLKPITPNATEKDVDPIKDTQNTKSMPAPQTHKFPYSIGQKSKLTISTPNTLSIGNNSSDIENKQSSDEH